MEQDDRMSQVTGVAHQRLFEAIFLLSMDAIGVSQAGVHTVVNDAYVRLFGFDTPQQMVGTPILDLIAPGARPDILARVHRRARGEDVENMYVTRGLRRDGSEFDMDVRAASYEAAGRVYTLVILRDITEVLGTQAALRETSEFYRAMFENYPLPKLLINPHNGLVVQANAAATAYYGYSPEQLCGMSISSLNTLPMEQIRRELGQAVKGKGLFLFKHRLASGEIRDVEIYTGPVDRQGVTYLLSTVVDITERNRLEAQLLQAQKMEAVGHLAGAIAHDFNNLLTAMMGFAALLQEELTENPAHRYNAEQVVRAGARAADLTRQLLAFSRRQVLQPQLLCINHILQEMSVLLRSAVGERVVIKMELDADLANTRADPVQLQQVVMNLTVNARDAMPEGGALTFRTFTSADDGDAVVLEVTDTGVGMDEETLARAFEPFFTTKEKGRGTGLGLSTVYGIITQSGGAVRVTSRAGHGTRFTLSLPRVTEPLPVADPTLSLQESVSLQGRNVLVVEDQGAVRSFLTRGLATRGCHVVEAQDGLAALLLLKDPSLPLDVMVCDVVMPRMSGTELYKELNSIRPSLKVVFISGYPAGLLDQELMATPSAAFLGKPFTMQQLAQVVGQVLARAPSVPTA